MDEQIILYGRQVLVNLIDQKGGEKILESQFADLVHRAEMKMIKFVLYSNISYLCEFRETIDSAIAESLARGAKIINLTIAESNIQAAKIIHSATVAKFKKIRS